MQPGARLYATKFAITIQIQFINIIVKIYKLFLRIHIVLWYFDLLQ